MRFFNIHILMDALFAPPCCGFWHNPWTAPYFYSPTPFPSIFYETGCCMPSTPSIFYNTVQSSPCFYGGGVQSQFVSQFNYQPVSMPQQNWNNFGWGSWGNQQTVQSAQTTTTPKADDTTKKTKGNEATPSSSKPASSSSKVSSSDKIDTSKQINLNGEDKNKLLGGTYKADYVNIGGIVHYRYEDCKASDLVVVNSGVGNGKMRKDAAKAFNEMKTAAAKDGVTLTCVSGYRSHQYQVGCFNKPGKMKNGIRNRAYVSAPSGYSEHHTGLAVDINTTSNDFKKTPAYRWLQQHAHEYGFEQSFPAGNTQGVSEESWHYRFVGKNHENDYIFKHAIANDSKMLAKRK